MISATSRARRRSTSAVQLAHHGVVVEGGEVGLPLLFQGTSVTSTLDAGTVPQGALYMVVEVVDNVTRTWRTPMPSGPVSLSSLSPWVACPPAPPLPLGPPETGASDRSGVA